MRIERIAITNYARVRDLALEIRGHAVIVGANDVGKTSSLRLLNLLLGASAAQLYQQLSVEDLADREKDLVVDAHLVDFTEQEQALFFREISVDQDTRKESMWVQLTAAVDPDDPESVSIRRWFPESGSDRAPTREQVAEFGWRYLPATRGASAAALDGPNSAFQLLLKATKLGGEEAKLVSLLSQFNDELGSSAEISELRRRITEHLSKAMPRQIGTDEVAVRTTNDPQDGVLDNVSMFFERDGQHVPMAEQSDGLRQLMAMTLFDLAEGAANVIAVDEPELHLHPSSQRTVAELFGQTRNQKLLVTHSPYIVHRFDPSQVIAVSPDGTCHQISAERRSAVEKELANWWSPRLLEVLTARYAILVEGVSDRVIVERAAQLLGMGLDRMGAVVFALDGAMKFPHVYKLLGEQGFCVPILGLVDEAEKMSWHGQIGGRPDQVFGTKLWASNPDLEAEYCAALTGPGTARALIKAGLCQARDILQSCEAGSLDDISPVAAAKYCRKDKISTAVAIASQMDSAQAAQIVSVHGLLSRLRALDSR